MADYTYAQLSQMQKEAVLRVQEMRKRAKFAAEDAAKRFDVHESVAECEQPPNENAAKRPVCTSLPNGLQGVSAQLTEKRKNHTIQSAPCGNCRRRENDFLQSLFGGKMPTEENDRALILALCFLLKAEKADEDLILALLYLLR